MEENIFYHFLLQNFAYEKDIDLNMIKPSVLSVQSVAKKLEVICIKKACLWKKHAASAS
jgi:hypothetical protein